MFGAIGVSVGSNTDFLLRVDVGARVRELGTPDVVGQLSIGSTGTDSLLLLLISRHDGCRDLGRATLRQQVRTVDRADLEARSNRARERGGGRGHEAIAGGSQPDDISGDRRELRAHVDGSRGLDAFHQHRAMDRLQRTRDFPNERRIRVATHHADLNAELRWRMQRCNETTWRKNAGRADERRDEHDPRGGMARGNPHGERTAERLGHQHIAR